MKELGLTSVERKERGDCNDVTEHVTAVLHVTCVTERSEMSRDMTHTFTQEKY